MCTLQLFKQLASTDLLLLGPQPQLEKLNLKIKKGKKKGLYDIDINVNHFLSKLSFYS